jgi:hypothetical protein
MPAQTGTNADLARLVAPVYACGPKSRASPDGLGPHLTSSGSRAGFLRFPFVCPPGSSPSPAFFWLPVVRRSPVQSLRPSLSGSVPLRLPLGFPPPSATSTLALSPGGPAGVGPVRPGLRSQVLAGCPAQIATARPQHRSRAGPGGGPGPITAYAQALWRSGIPGARAAVAVSPCQPPSPDRLLTVDCGRRDRTLWTGAHVMD